MRSGRVSKRVERLESRMKFLRPLLKMMARCERVMKAYSESESRYLRWGPLLSYWSTNLRTNQLRVSSKSWYLA